ncbi:MAG: phosphoglycerate mutase family protein [Acidobacteriota bacterium]
MRRGQRVPLAATLLTSACLLASAAAARGAVFIVRHAEKQSDSNEKGVPLSEAGRARAARLAAVLKDAEISAIYSTDTVRTLATAGPLAAASKIAPQIYDASGPDSAGRLAARISKEHPTANILVVGHSNTVGPLITALGCAETVAVAPQEYDGLWIVVPPQAGPQPRDGGARPGDSSLPPRPSGSGTSTLLRLRL